MTVLSFAISWALAGLLISSGLSKLTRRFTTDLANYRILPTAAVVPVAAVLPWIEIAVGALIIASPLPAVWLVVAALLLGAFTAGIVTNLLRGRRIPCGCRGSSPPITWRLAATNTAWVLAALATASTSSPSATLTWFPAADTLALLITIALLALTLRLAAAHREMSPVLARVALATSVSPGS